MKGDTGLHFKMPSHYVFYSQLKMTGSILEVLTANLLKIDLLYDHIILLTV